MDCDFCGVTPAAPETLRPVREVVTVTDSRDLGDGIVVQVNERQELGDEHTACEDCYPEVFEPENKWRLENECPQCWSHPCECV